MKTKLSFIVSIILLSIMSITLSAQIKSRIEKIAGKEVKTKMWKGMEVQFLANQVAIKIAPYSTQTNVHDLLKSFDAKIINLFDKLGWGLIELPETEDEILTIDAITKLPFVLFAEPNIVTRVCMEPNDPYYVGTSPATYSHQWALKNTSQTPPTGTNDADIDAPEAWDISVGNPDVIIAILDSGIPMLNGSLSHPDLDDINKIILGSDCTSETDGTVKDNFGHGTHVAGIAAAESNNGTGIAGVAWNCKIMVIQVFDAYGSAGSSFFYNGVVNAVDYQRNNPGKKVIINYSGGGATSQQKLDAVIYANTYGVPIVASAGNQEGGSVLYPAAYSSSYSNVIAVTSTDANDIFSSFSSQGSQVCVSAPGGYNYNQVGNVTYFNDQSLLGKNIYSATPNYAFNLAVDPWYLNDPYSTDVAQVYGYMPGTSMAAPHVAGIAALMLSVNPNLSPSQIRTIIQLSAEDKGTPGFDYYYGYGRVNAYRALKYTIENYGGTFNQSVTLPAGDTWNLQPGVTLTFASGCALIVNGTLNAVGNSTNNITFTRSGTSGIWGGIQFNPYSSGTINNAIISYAAKGVDINQISALTISDSEISNCSSAGIYIYGTTSMALSEPIITNCKIHDNTNSGGIVMYYSSPDITRCNIYNNYTGIGIADYSSPRFGYSSVLGKNNIHDNTNIGVYALRNSSPTEGGNNIIAANTFRNAQAVDNCYVVLENNWWGNNPPDASKIAALSGSTIDYTPYLTAPPSLSIYAQDNYLSTTGIQKSMVASSNDSPVKENTVFINPIDSDPSASLSISQLNTLWKQSKKSDINSFKTYLTELSTKKEKKLLYASAKLILSLYEKENRIKMVDEIISDYKDQSIIETAYMNKFLYYFNELKDYNQSSKTMKELEAKYPKSTAVQEMKDHFLSLSSIDIQKEYNISVQEDKTTKVESGNSLFENYPNPFNPATKISFSLKESGRVSLRIYDVLGKEVANLAEGYFEAGKHTATFDGSNLASGIYFYRLVTPNTTITKKMVLTK